MNSPTPDTVVVMTAEMAAKWPFSPYDNSDFTRPCISAIKSGQVACYNTATRIDVDKEELARLRTHIHLGHEMPIGPDRCPFTGRKFWGNIEHEELGLIGTYGGPFDTYTIPQREDDDPDYFVYRFDQDAGHWQAEGLCFIACAIALNASEPTQ